MDDDIPILHGGDAVYAAHIIAELAVIRIICSALDDVEQIGRDDRYGQANAILDALTRYGYTITTTEMGKTHE